MEPTLDGISLTKPDDRPPAKIEPPKKRPQAQEKAKAARKQKAQ